MALWCWQHTNGSRAGPDAQVVPQHEGQSDAELMDVKRASAEAIGFTVVSYKAGESMHLVKHYDPAAQGISRKDRWFEVRE